MKFKNLKKTFTNLSLKPLLNLFAAEPQPSSGVEDESSAVFPPIQRDSSTDDNIRDSLSISSEDETPKDVCEEAMNDSQSSTVHAENPTTESITTAAEVVSENIDEVILDENTEDVVSQVPVPVVEANNKKADEPVLEVAGGTNEQLEDEISQAALSMDNDLPTGG